LHRAARARMDEPE